MNGVLMLPVLIPFFTAVTLLFFGRRWKRLQKAVSLAGASGLLIAGAALFRTVLKDGVQVLYLGSWPAPFGITFIADTLTALMVCVTGLVAVAVTLSVVDRNEAALNPPGFHVLTHTLLVGVCGSFLTGDLFNLYVWFEVMLLSSFALLIQGATRAQLEASVKYVVLNFLSGLAFLVAVGLIYGKTGTLNLADLAGSLQEDESLPIVSSAVLLFTAFGIKAALFPFFFWLPASYHTPPPVVTALFAALLTKVGLYALIRTFTLVFPEMVRAPVLAGLTVVAVVTMVTGVLAAASQFHIRRILAVHIVSQVGYVALGLAFFTVQSVAAAIFYLVHLMFVKTALFFVADLAFRKSGSEDLKKMGGLYLAAPGLAILFLLGAFSLAGLPPSSGFFAKYALLVEGFRAGWYGAVAIALLVSLATLYSMLKIWSEVFWKPAPASQRESAGASVGVWMAALLLTAVSLAMGFWPEPFLEISARAAAELMNPAPYIDAVFSAGKVITR